MIYIKTACSNICLISHNFLPYFSVEDLGGRAVKAWVCGRSHAEIAGSNGCLSVVSVVCCQVEVSATGRSLVQRSPIGCVVSGCERGISQAKPRSTRSVEP